MSKFKAERMRAMFGTRPGAICKDCGYFREYTYRGKTYRKCIVYGITNSEASDWAGRWEACGLYPDRPYHGDKDIINVPDKEPEEPLPGQTTIFDFLEKGEN